MVPSLSGLGRLGLFGLALFQSYPHDEFRFTYQPDPGHRVTLVFESEGVLRLNGFPDIADGSEGRFESMASITERVREDLGDATIIATVYDSSYAQVDLGSGWIELPVEWNPIGPFLWLRDRQFVSTPFEDVADSFFMNAARGLQWTPRIPLPEQDVAIGQTWDVEFTFPVTTQIPSDSALLIAAELVARGTARLDSLIPRRLDTLAFVTLSAGLDQTVVPEAFSNPGGDLSVLLSGSVAGSYIWSSGWHTWVGNETRVSLEHRVPELPNAVMWLTLAATSRIRL